MGCSGGRKADPVADKNQAAPPEKKQDPELPKTIHAGSGSSEQYSEGPKREKQWSVKWEEAQIDVTEQAKLGRMQKVSGELFADGKPKGTYSADSGFADKGKNLLVLKGKVRISSNDPKLKATLLCDEVRYDADEKLVRARGNVRVESEQGNLSTLSELWATPDLTSFGTPDMFKTK